MCDTWTLDTSCGELESVICGTGSRPDMVLQCLKDCLADGSFVCVSDGMSIPPSWQCDAAADCLDASDERDCPAFICSSGESLPPEWECDGDEDCADGSDELGCPEQPPINILCPCEVPDGWICDGNVDCADGSDEAGCDLPGGGQSSPNCTPGEQSTPGMTGDPCPQSGTDCSNVGGSAIATCGEDGSWGDCTCVV